MNEPIRIAHILGKMDSGGIESVLMNYYHAIDSSKIQFDFFLDKTSKFPQQAELIKNGTRFFLLPPYSKIWKYQKSLYTYLCENKYKIIHSHLSTMSIFPLFAAQRANIPIRICHNHTTASWAEPKKTFFKYILRPFYRFFATDYFACGEKAAKWMYGEKNFKKNKIFIMPNAIDKKKFEYNKDFRKKIREEFKISDTDLIIGHIGRFCTQKNHIFLLDIFNTLHKKNKNSKLLLVGEGNLKNNIKEKVAQLQLEQNVIFAGTRKDTYHLYNAIDVFCLPSKYEGLPVVVVETLMNGLPTICSNKITSEINKFDNVTMLPIKKKNLPQWVTTIGNSMRNEVISHSPIIEQFDITNQAHRLCTFYENRIKSIAK